MSKHRHISKKLLLAARRGQVSWRHLAELLLERLVALCSGCRREAAAAAAEEIPEEAYRQPVSRAVQLEAHRRRYEEDRAAAPTLLALLQQLSPEQRLLRIRNSPDRFANLALGEDLIDEARACLPHDAQGSLAWAQAAQAVADIYPTPYYPHRILAMAYQGNAHRAAGDFARARELLHRARSQMSLNQVTDTELGAELHSLLGSLATDERRFEEAAEHLESAAALFQTLGDEDQLARVLMQLGHLHGIRGNLPQAVEADKAAVLLLSPHRNLRLYLSARLNHACHLLEAGQPEEAREVLDWEHDLFTEHADTHTQLRASWLQADLSRGFGDLVRAERGYLAVKDELTSQGQGFDVALVCLDLAGLYHQQQRFEEVAEIASQAVELFQANALHQEALAALLLLRDAALQRTLTSETILRVAAFLREAERAPTGRSQSPN